MLRGRCASSGAEPGLTTRRCYRRGIHLQKPSSQRPPDPHTYMLAPKPLGRVRSSSSSKHGRTATRSPTWHVARDCVSLVRGFATAAPRRSLTDACSGIWRRKHCSKSVDPHESTVRATCEAMAGGDECRGDRGTRPATREILLYSALNPYVHTPLGTDATPDCTHAALVQGVDQLAIAVSAWEHLVLLVANCSAR